MNKGQLRTAVANAADALNSPRWTFTAGGEVDLLISAAVDQEWRRLLDASSFYRIARKTPTSDSSGYYAVSDLSTASERLYKVIALAIGNIVYEQTKLTHYLLAPETGLSNYPQYLWFFEGEKIMALPKTALQQASIIVNHLPTAYNSLANDSTAVVWPDGYEQVMWLAGAVNLLMKGGVESGAAADLGFRLEGARKDMLEDLTRRSLKPVGMEYNDYASDWAS